MIENEVKLKLDKEKLQTIISKLGKPEFFKQENSFYLVPSGFLRLRKEKGNLILTYKGKKIESKFKACEEIEINLASDSKDKFHQILNNSGINFMFSYQKNRANYHFDDCVVSVDHL